MKYWQQLLQMILGLGVCLFTACTPGRPSDPAQANWLTNADQAVALARQQNKPLFIAFLAPGWSSASGDSQKSVLDTQAFKDYADANLVLLKIDFSQKGLSPEMEKAYSEMAKGLQVDHFPVFFLSDPANNVGPFQRLNTVGPAGPTEFVGQITGLLAEYRNQLAALKAAGQVPGAPGPRPTSAPSQAGVKSGFPSPDELLRKAQDPQAAPPAGTNAPLIQLK